jgi:hypothetical protein
VIALESIKVIRAVAFHFRRERLPVLSKVIAALTSGPIYVKTVITTNTAEPKEISLIEQALMNQSEAYLNVDIVPFPALPHPWLLPWAHKQLLATAFKSGDYTHFAYTEDDIALTSTNLIHWIQMRESIGNDSPFYPSFSRIEYSTQRKGWFFTDLTSKLWLELLPKLVLPRLGDDLGLYSLPNSYQAMYLYDNTLMEEYVGADEFQLHLCKELPNINHPTWGGGGVAEASARGISHRSVPVMFQSRNLMPIYTSTGLPHSGFLIHHTTNSYCDANFPEGFGTVGVSDLKLG